MPISLTGIINLQFGYILSQKSFIFRHVVFNNNGKHVINVIVYVSQSILSNLLISNLYGSAAVTPYDIVYKVFYMSVQVHGIIIMPIWSAYTAAAAQKDMGWIKNTMKRLNQVTVLISAGVIIGIFVFKPFARIWLHKDLEYSNTLILIIAIYMIATMIGNSYSSFLCGVGHIKASVIISGIGAVINIPCSIYFSRDCGMGQVGIILGSLVVIMISVFVLPAISYKWISQKSKEWGYEA